MEFRLEGLCGPALVASESSENLKKKNANSQAPGLLNQPLQGQSPARLTNAAGDPDAH